MFADRIGVSPIRPKLPAASFVLYQQELHLRFGRLMPVLLGGSLTAGVLLNPGAARLSQSGIHVYNHCHALHHRRDNPDSPHQRTNQRNPHDLASLSAARKCNAALGALGRKPHHPHRHRSSRLRLTRLRHYCIQANFHAMKLPSPPDGLKRD